MLDLENPKKRIVFEEKVLAEHQHLIQLKEKCQWI